VAIKNKFHIFLVFSLTARVGDARALLNETGTTYRQKFDWHTIYSAIIFVESKFGINKSKIHEFSS